MAKKPDAKDNLFVDDGGVITPMPLTQAQQVRLECARIAYRHDRKAEDTVAKAAELERYVLDGKAASGEPENDGQGALPLAPV